MEVEGGGVWGQSAGMIRMLVSMVLLGGLVWFLEGERRGGRFMQVDEGFEDFLIANVRGRFVAGTEGAGDVVLVEMRESDADEYAAWPPEPIDWRMVLEAVKGWEPEVLVVPEVLNWGNPGPEFVSSVGTVLAGFPSVVLGVDGEFGSELPASMPFMGGLENRFPTFERVTLAGEASGAASLNGLVRAPDERAGAGAELGLWVPEEGGVLPYVLQVKREGEEVAWVPTLLAQTMSRVTRSPYVRQRLRLGAGAGAHLEGGVFVPLTAGGGVEVGEETVEGVRVVNALELMTGQLAETLDAETLAAVKAARVVVVGISSGDGSGLRQLAGGMASVLALPVVKRVPLLWQYGIWGVAGVLALGIIRQGNKGAMMKALGLVFAAFVASYLVFESEMIWCPPTIPAAVLLAGGLLGAVIGKRALVPVPGAEKVSLDEAEAGAN